MNFEILQNLPLVEVLGWTLFHSIWQILFIGIGLFVGLKAATGATANFRYLLACAAMCLMLILPLTTFVWLLNSASENQAKSAHLKPESSYLAQREKPPFEKTVSGDITTQTQISSENQESNFEFIAAFQKQFANNFARILPLLVWFWLFGVAVFALRTTGGFWHLGTSRRQSKLVSEEWQTKFVLLSRKVGVYKRVNILESAVITAPVVIGWLKPVVLVPASVLTGLSPSQLEAVLVHELIHIRRHDFLVNFLQTAIENLLFFHPSVWWISRQIRELREFACDDAVVKFYGERLNYASALANLETLRQGTQSAQPQYLVVAANGGKLMNRIRRILQKETEIKRPHSLWSAGLALMLISAFALITFSVGERVSVKAKSTMNAKKIAIGFVSIPPIDRSANSPADSTATAHLLIEKLKSHHVPAVGFLQGAMISDGEKMFPVRTEIVRIWRDAGFEIGIGGYKHIWFYDTSFDDYVANTEKNEKIAKQILAEKNLPLRYFSYPFLNTGKTTEDKNRFENWLAERGLRSVKYTFDNQEWMYSYAYDMARNDNDIAGMKQIRHEFLDYMEKMLAHYEAYSQDMFGRDINQTMVLTTSRLIADTGDELFGMLEKNGYNFVAMDEAQADAAYQTPENFTGVKAGISWFERWAMAQNKKLRDEPKVDALVEKAWDTRKIQK
ncbi:MAG: M56 family metallopeptidase [Pyrinomonadaceae bacterium]